MTRVCANNSPRRRLARLKSYDYALNGAYYVTIVTKNRLCLFGDVTNDAVQLNDAGKMIAAQWRTLPTKFPNTQLDEFIVMPNHIHGIIIFVGASLVGAHSNASNSGDKNDIPTKKLGDVIGAYKSLTTVAFVQGVKTLKWPPSPKNCGNEIITNTSLETTKTFLAFNNTLPIIRHGGTKTLIIYKKLLNLPPSFGEF